MSYNILETKIEHKDKQIMRVIVLVEISEGDIRAIAADTKPKSGYMFLKSNTVLSDRLLQEVAGTGMQISFAEADKIFFNWRSKYA